ncbi:MAG: UvrB/UvrC motif-containing protein [Planctomycetes bacterium]|nr:UvrB/UvrC motif-containing protein [Planctomycetota bacterium]
MKCQACNKFAATVHQLDVEYSSDGDAEFINSDYCSRCAKKMGLNVSNTENFPQVISVLTKALFPPNDKSKSKKSSPIKPEKHEEAQGILSCEKCGWTLDDFRQTSRLGCPNDYIVFKEYLSDVFERMHGQTKHVDWRTDNQLEQLNEKLQQAVETEDYEACAKLRDQISNLQTELNKDLSSDG